MKQIIQNVRVSMISRRDQTISSPRRTTSAARLRSAKASDCADAGAPSGINPISSGLRRMNTAAGITTRTKVNNPKTVQVERQPTQTNSVAVTIGIKTLANP